MKKILIPLVLTSLLALGGCATNLGGQSFKVFQTLDEGALAKRCDFGDSGCYGLTVFLLTDIDPMMYNGKIVTVQKPVVLKTWTYETQAGGSNTVPIVTDQNLSDLPLEPLK